MSGDLNEVLRLLAEAICGGVHQAELCAIDDDDRADAMSIINYLAANDYRITIEPIPASVWVPDMSLASRRLDAFQADLDNLNLTGREEAT